MTATETGTEEAEPSGRFWIAKRVWPYARVVLLSMLPVPDLAARVRMRRAARKLVTLAAWPDMQATSAQTAQLAMLRLLWLQRQTRRAVRGRHRDAAIMLARASLETLFLGLYCMRETKAVGQLHAANIRAIGDAFAYLGEEDIVPAEVIRECAARLGKPGPPPKVWHLATAIDKANGSRGARDIYGRLYGPLSNYTVHASGGTLMRHVTRDGKLTARPSRSWNRRSPARVADAAAGILAADLTQNASMPHDQLLAYANRHIERALLPVAVMGVTGVKGALKPRQILQIISLARQMHDYLWDGPAAADPLGVRTAYVREHFAALLDLGELDIPAGSLDPFIDHVADKLARLVPEPGTPDAESGETGAL